MLKQLLPLAGILAYSSPAQADFATWANSSISDSALRGGHHDPDADGLSNLMEYAIGTNPTAVTPSSMSLLLTTTPAVGLRMLWAARPDVVWRLELSDNLISWSPPASGIEWEQPAAGGGFVRGVDQVATPLGGQRLFVRVAFVLEPAPSGPDSDGDGLADNVELALGYNPADIDTDGDGLADAWERLTEQSAALPPPVAWTAPWLEIYTPVASVIPARP